MINRVLTNDSIDEEGRIGLEGLNCGTYQLKLVGLMMIDFDGCHDPTVPRVENYLSAHAKALLRGLLRATKWPERPGSG